MGLGAQEKEYTVIVRWQKITMVDTRIREICRHSWLSYDVITVFGNGFGDVSLEVIGVLGNNSAG